MVSLVFSFQLVCTKEDQITHVCLGGADTTVSAINTFLLMMICYPEIQDKAQAELDRVVGKGQLPDFSDEPSLPYISALVKESLRYDIMTSLSHSNL